MFSYQGTFIRVNLTEKDSEFVAAQEKSCHILLPKLYLLMAIQNIFSDRKSQTRWEVHVNCGSHYQISCTANCTGTLMRLNLKLCLSPNISFVYDVHISYVCKNNFRSRKLFQKVVCNMDSFCLSFNMSNPFSIRKPACLTFDSMLVDDLATIGTIASAPLCVDLFAWNKPCATRV